MWQTYEESNRRDGYVSLEVSPHLAHDTDGTVAEAVRLWTLVDRPNLMIKVPATRAGLPAIRRLAATGINVNITLLFSVARYREVADAYLAGLEEYGATGRPLDRIASVASFFLSRIDTLIDRRVEQLNTDTARALRGQAAIACACLAYQEYKTMLASVRWQRLAAQGARPQRLLWASTSTKDSAYYDVKYVEALIGLDTVNTLPFETITAYRDHGNPALRLEQNMDAARALPARLAALGIGLEAVGDELERQGVQKFVEPFDRLLATLAQRVAELAA
jgi:transaldolase